MRILLIDDNEQITKMLTTYLLLQCCCKGGAIIIQYKDVETKAQEDCKQCGMWIEEGVILLENILKTDCGGFRTP